MPTEEKTKTIDHAAFVERTASGAIRGARVIGRPDGWSVTVRDGRTPRALTARRGALRVFRRFETLVGYLKKIGVEHYEVDASGYQSRPSPRTRPDTATRMKQAHQAAEHDRWFRLQVERTLEDIERGTIRLIPNDEHRARWQRKRAELLARDRRRE